jgi:hypothetical protein
LLQRHSSFWFYRIATAAEPATYKFLATGSDGLLSAVLVAYRGVLAQNPIDTDAQALHDDSNTGRYDLPVLTTVTPNDMLLAMVTNQRGMGAVWTAPSGMVVRSSVGEVATFDGLQVAAGPIGAKQAICDSMGGGAIEMVALRPR